MAKKKASTSRSTKKTSKKKVSSTASTASSPAKKKTTSKRTAGSSKKSSTKKKPSTKKKTSSSAAAPSKKKSTKKPVSKTATTGTVKKTTKKKTTKAAVNKNTATTKKAASSSVKKKTATAAASKKKTTTAAASKKKATSKKTTKKKKTTRSRSEGGSTKIKGRSVAEVASAAETDAQGYVLIKGRRVRMVSLKGVDRTKKKKTTRVVPVEETNVDLPPKQRKSKLARKDLVYFRTLLLDRRRDLVSNLGSMEDEALRPNGGEVSQMPIHMADIGSDTYEQDFMLGLAESERQRLKEIDQALMRIEEGTYGVCMKTGEEIPRARLEAKPWARYTIEAAREMERTGFNS